MAAIDQVQPAISIVHEDDAPCVTCDDVQKVVMVALEILTYLGLVLFQGPTFGAGWLLGFTCQIIFKESCTEAVDNILAAIGNRPWLLAGGVIAFSIICPHWLLIGPSAIGGVACGIRTAELCQ